MSTEVVYIEKITLSGILDGSTQVEFNRVKPPVDWVKVTDVLSVKPGDLLDKAPPRPTISTHGVQPPRVSLQATVGDLLGEGSTGIVCNLLAVTSLQDQHQSPPALVMKFARLNRRKALYHEAWVYDEMETIQGVVIPRCYGYFEATISSVSLLRSRFRDPDAASGDYEWPHPEKLCILLLERLGGPISLPLEENVDAKTIGEELKLLFAEFSQFGVVASKGLKHGNILIHSPSEPTLPVPMSRTSFRIIDFDEAIKTRETVEFIDGQHNAELALVIEDMEEGIDWNGL